MKAVWSKLRAEWDSCAIGLTVFLFHLWHVPAVARGALFQKDNIAFDFDIGRFVSLWGTSPFQIEQNAAYYAVRHPLAILLRLVGRPLVANGLEPHVAACSIAAFCAALSSVLAFRIARRLGVRRYPAYLLTAMWTFSTASLLLGVLPEAYGLALVALAWQMMLAIRWTQGDRPAFAVRVAAGVVNLGITVTNVALSGLVELVCRVVQQPARKALLGTAAFGAAVAAIGLVASAASFHIWPVDHVDTSAHAAKQLYWSASSAEGDTRRQSPVDVAWTFGAIAFVAPPIAPYPSGDREDPYLYDLRGYNYDRVGEFAVLGWLGLLLLGVVAAARDRQMRPIWLIAGAWAAANIALHSYWQFRQTVFLYAAHSHIAFFVFVLAGARWAQSRHGKCEAVHTAAVGLVTLLLILNNMQLYVALPRLN
jgi:hypothetical protein